MMGVPHCSIYYIIIMHVSAAVATTLTTNGKSFKFYVGMEYDNSCVIVVVYKAIDSMVRYSTEEQFLGANK